MVSRTRIGKWFLLIILAAALAAPLSFADTIKLKNGRVVKGQVVRYGNGEFIVLLPAADSRASQQDRLILFADTVESIEFAAAAAGAVPAPGEKLVVLDASKEIVSTGVELRRGERVRVTASGEMQFPDGRVSTPKGLDKPESWPFPGERFGILIAMVGDPRATIYELVGEQAEFEAARDGELLLQINARSLQGARGAYTARILPLTGASAVAAAAPATASSSGRQLRKQIDVPAERDWTDTGLDLLAGDKLRIIAEGTINYASTKSSGPAGGDRDWRDLLRALPVNDAGRGALIGLIGQAGTATPFYVGTEANFEVDRNGRLFLGTNDDDYRNNRGSFRVTVEITPGVR